MGALARATTKFASSSPTTPSSLLSKSLPPGDNKVTPSSLLLSILLSLSFHPNVLSNYCLEFLSRFKGRGDLLEYARASGITISSTTAHPYSEDDNMFHISHESGILEDPAAAAPEDVYSWTKDPVHTASDKPALITIDFEVPLSPFLSSTLSLSYSFSLLQTLVLILIVGWCASKGVEQRRQDRAQGPSGPLPLLE